MARVNHKKVRQLLNQERNSITDRQFFVSAAIFALALVPVIKGVHPIAVICISGVLGVAIGGAAGVF